MKHAVSMTKEPPSTSYEEWMHSEGIPIAVEECGIEDVSQLDRKPWARMGGKGSFIYLDGQKQAGFTGMYVAEIPPHGALEPEKHMYEEMIYVLRGTGATEFWDDESSKRTLEWGEGSLFSPPLNTTHRLYNLSGEPAIVLGVTNAPIILDLYHNPQFVFGDTFKFQDRYDGRGDFFNVGD